MTTAAQAEIERSEQEERDRHAAIDAAMKGWAPRADKVVLAKLRATERKVGSIVVPGQSSIMGDKVVEQEKGIRARVVAAGPDSTLEANMVVYASKFAGALVSIGGFDLVCVSETELLLVEAPRAN